MSTITVRAKFGKVENVPLPKWKELVPYWPKIAKAFFEVLTENDFNPCTATIKRPDGFVADRNYWKKFLENPDTIPLKEARRFLAELVKHKDFFEAIRNFNDKKKVNWLHEKNMDILGGYVYSFYYILRPALKAISKKGKKILKPKLICETT